MNKKKKTKPNKENTDYQREENETDIQFITETRVNVAYEKLRLLLDSTSYPALKSSNTVVSV